MSVVQTHWETTLMATAISSTQHRHHSANAFDLSMRLDVFTASDIDAFINSHIGLVLNHKLVFLWTAVYDMLIRPIEVTAVFLKDHTHTHDRFTALFPGPPGWAGARRELLDFMVQGKISRDGHTVQLGATPSGLIRTRLHHPTFFTSWMPFLPPNQRCQSTEGN